MKTRYSGSRVATMIRRTTASAALLARCETDVV
jgi:hypothetical protein